MSHNEGQIRDDYSHPPVMLRNIQWTDSIEKQGSKQYQASISILYYKFQFFITNLGILDSGMLCRDNPK